MKLYRQLAVRFFNQADSQRLVLLLRGERMSAGMSLAWLTMSKALERSPEGGRGIVVLGGQGF